MTPYLEVRPLPAPSRRLLLVCTAALLVVPVGALLPGGTTEPLLRLLAMLAIAILAPILGLAYARPRQLVEVDADRGTIIRRTTGHLPDPRARVEEFPIADATAVVLEELGTPTTPEWGVRIELRADDPILLRSYADRDLAQDTVDHLVLLGLPGHSRAHAREAALTAAPPATWL